MEMFRIEKSWMRFLVEALRLYSFVTVLHSYLAVIGYVLPSVTFRHRAIVIRDMNDNYLHQ